MEWTDELKQEVSRLWHKGLSSRQIGDKVGLRQTQIKGVLRRMDLRRSMPAGTIASVHADKRAQSMQCGTPEWFHRQTLRAAAVARERLKALEQARRSRHDQ